ncbi:Trk system potassium transporter TrkA [Marinifilum caeruleilacunae]|uniref:Trk system potassium uptake protein TrkA n=1 Tax=Marinifilum caeruleilacunae TaxID=2499076 RepID=A0ABX1WYX0_9BACT|nr:Trk system potassium transporter TrkA [Marinifilum caeruleilacunae]NOU61176.1 Trk system potassium transporter TrkA [Marinifilum caeruleilacunae]
MKIVIAGAGAVGTHLAKMLSHQDHDIILLDQDEEKLKEVDSHLDLLTIVGSSSSLKDLKEASVKKADLFIAVTQSETTNITSTILAKKLGAIKTIARIDNQEYLIPENKEYLQSLGIDELIYPEKLAAKEVISYLSRSGTRQMYEFSGGKLLLYGIKISSKSIIMDKTMAEVAEMTADVDFRAVAIKREDVTIIPRGHNRFSRGDLVFVVSKPESIEKVMLLAGKQKYEVKNAMILGGSRIGQKTAVELGRKMNLKLLEIDKEKSLKLADLLQDTLVINGDGRDKELLKEEGIHKMDAFVAVTGNSETNILACLLAKKMGVRRTIAEVENIDYIDLADNIGVGTMINKKLLAASYIYRFTMDADVQHCRWLTVSDAEVMELTAKKGSKITKASLKDLDFPDDANIGGIIRDEDSIIATGETQIQANDKVVVFTMPSAIKKVEKFFK